MFTNINKYILIDTDRIEVFMKESKSKKWSKEQLLEVMLDQSSQIENLENEILSLKSSIEVKDRQINEMSDLVSVTNRLLELVKMIEQKMDEVEKNNEVQIKNMQKREELNLMYTTDKLVQLVKLIILQYKKAV